MKLCLSLILFLSAGFSHCFSQKVSFEAYSQKIPGSSMQAIDMAPIPGGTFLMGSPKNEEGRSNDEGPATKVTVDSYWIGTYEITWDQYELFVNENLSDLRKQISSTSDVKVDAISTPTPPYIDMSYGMGREGYPAGSMTQYAAVMYAKWLTAKTGNFYRLPTEAEWEYACRAGTSSAYYYGNNSDYLERYAWYKDNSEEKYRKIGQKEPNKWGLYDMMGNVAEWTMDQYEKDYFEKLRNGVASNPLFLPNQLYPRSLRGGSWEDPADQLRCANRQGSDPKWKKLDPQMPKSSWWFTREPLVGFRLVRPKVKPSQEEIKKYWLKAIDDY